MVIWHMIRRRTLTRRIWGGDRDRDHSRSRRVCRRRGSGEAETDEFDEETATDHYNEGIADLVETAETLDEWAGGRPGREQRAIERLRTTVDSARSSFDETAEVAPPDFIDQIEQARAIAAFHGELLDFYEL